MCAHRCIIPYNHTIHRSIMKVLDNIMDTLIVALGGNALMKAVESRTVDEGDHSVYRKDR